MSVVIAAVIVGLVGVGVYFLLKKGASSSSAPSSGSGGGSSNTNQTSIKQK